MTDYLLNAKICAWLIVVFYGLWMWKGKGNVFAVTCFALAIMCLQAAAWIYWGQQ